jgi:hypothetical protein
MVVLPEPGNPVSHITGKWATVEVTDEVVGFISICLSPSPHMGFVKDLAQLKNFSLCEASHSSALPRVFLLNGSLLMVECY